MNYYLCLLGFLSAWHFCECSLYYTTNSEFGIFMAISVPISLPHRNVFVSYNYEFNYYQPEHVYKYPPILIGSTDEYLTYGTTGRKEGGGRCQNCTENEPKLEQNSKSEPELETEPKLNSEQDSKSEPESETDPKPEPVAEKSEVVSREKRALSLMTRAAFYTMLRDKLDRTGYPGEACLLRLICDTNDSSLGDINGLLGNLVHIIFTPSSSRDEQLPNSYYQAEAHGRRGQCDSYGNDCRDKVLDLISLPVEQILNDIASTRL